MMQTTLRPSTIGALRTRIRARWSELSDADIDRAAGSLDKLVELIHADTGETRPAIKRELRKILAA
jgi:hypothetical protein